jgi:hypothetical protein
MGCLCIVYSCGLVWIGIVMGWRGVMKLYYHRYTSLSSTCMYLCILPKFVKKDMRALGLSSVLGGLIGGGVDGLGVGVERGGDCL